MIAICFVSVFLRLACRRIRCQLEEIITIDDNNNIFITMNTTTSKNISPPARSTSALAINSSSTVTNDDDDNNINNTGKRRRRRGGRSKKKKRKDKRPVITILQRPPPIEEKPPTVALEPSTSSNSSSDATVKQSNKTANVSKSFSDATTVQQSNKSSEDAKRRQRRGARSPKPPPPPRQSYSAALQQPLSLPDQPSGTTKSPARQQEPMASPKPSKSPGSTSKQTPPKHLGAASLGNLKRLDEPIVTHPEQNKESPVEELLPPSPKSPSTPHNHRSPAFKSPTDGSAKAKGPPPGFLDQPRDSPASTLQPDAPVWTPTKQRRPSSASFEESPFSDVQQRTTPELFSSSHNRPPRYPSKKDSSAKTKSPASRLFVVEPPPGFFETPTKKELRDVATPSCGKKPDSPPAAWHRDVSPPAQLDPSQDPVIQTPVTQLHVVGPPGFETNGTSIPPGLGLVVPTIVCPEIQDPDEEEDQSLTTSSYATAYQDEWFDCYSDDDDDDDIVFSSAPPPTCTIRVLDQDGWGGGKNWYQVSFDNHNNGSDDDDVVDMVGLNMAEFCASLADDDAHWVFDIQLESSGLSCRVTSSDIQEGICALLRWPAHNLVPFTIQKRKPWQKGWQFDLQLPVDEHFVPVFLV